MTNIMPQLCLLGESSAVKFNWQIFHLTSFLLLLDLSCPQQVCWRTGLVIVLPGDWVHDHESCCFARPWIHFLTTLFPTHWSWLCGGTVSALKQQSRNQGPEQKISEFAPKYSKCGEDKTSAIMSCLQWTPCNPKPYKFNCQMSYLNEMRN
jgi:hypothetical protein